MKSFSQTKKGVMPIVTVALLLVVVVVAAVGFQGWVQQYQSTILSNVEEGNNVALHLGVERIIGDELLISANRKGSLNYLEIKNGSQVKCRISREKETDFKGDTLFSMTFDPSTVNETHVTDLSGYDLDGVINNATYRTSGCVSSGCFYFGGEDDHLKMDTGIEQATKEISFLAWVKPTEEDISSSTLLLYRQWTDFGLMLEGGYPTFFIDSDYDADGKLKQKTPQLEAEEWTHLVGTFDRGEGKMYVNGDLVATQPFNETEMNPHSSFGVGMTTTNGSQFGWHDFNGTLDEIAIYGKALEEEEVKELFRTRKALFYEHLISSGVKSLNLSGCNLTSGNAYTLLLGTQSGLVERELRID